LLYLILFLFSLALTYLVKEYAIKKSIMDIPNERSSHSFPTPRGGGIAIIVTFFVGLFWLREFLTDNLIFALLSSLPIVIISLLDDLYTLSSKVRLLVQTLSAILALYFLGGVNSIDFSFFQLTGWWLNIIVVVIIVWMTNLYNFLDGIDGYAGSEAFTLGLGMFLIFSNPLGLLLLVGSLGFLLFNWDKASIFMGDVGSATLGFIVAILIFSDTSNGNIYFWLVLTSLFWYDATLTLFRRYKNGERIMEAHKKHAYQRLVQSGWSHQKVTLGLIIYNIIFLVLLWLTHYWELVFIVNLISLFMLMRYVDSKKDFKEC